jgi:hypothetical protein
MAELSSPSPAFLAMRSFAKEHAAVSLLLNVAARDYADARCLLQNKLVTGGLTQGAQAIEKSLKAYILLKDPSRNVKRLNHALPKLLSEVQVLFPDLPLSQYADASARFGQHYATRYPDNPDASTSRTSAEIVQLDEFIVFLNENLPSPLTVKMRTGVYAAITFSLGIARTVSPTEFWIKRNNQALAPFLPRIEDDYKKVMKELYPDQPRLND